MNKNTPKIHEKSYDYKALKNKFRFERWNFWLMHGYKLNLYAPQSFSEKVVFKKIFDRNPLLPIVADKYRVRDFVKERLGKHADELLIPLLWSGTEPSDIDFASLPKSFIAKANHGSAMNQIIEDKNVIDRDKFLETCRNWLTKDFGVRRNEWCYQPIPRRILIEELMQTQNGQIPADYKLYMFDGKLGLIEIIADRFNNRTAAYFDRDFNPVDVRNGSKKSTEITLPPTIDKMIEIAEKLSDGFDHIRVDLYDLEGDVRFGELTNYNSSGRVPFRPRQIDFWLGEFWQVNRSNLRTDISPEDFKNT